jgi:hypothetical protein
MFRVLGNLDLYTLKKILELSSNACQLSFREQGFGSESWRNALERVIILQIGDTIDTCP